MESGESSNLYPLRTSEYIKKALEIESLEPLKLTEQEKAEVSSFEEDLFKKLEPLVNLSPKIHEIYPEWLLTDEGWQQAVETYGKVNRSVLARKKPSSIEEIKDFFLNLSGIKDLDVDERDKITNASERYARDLFIGEFINTLKTNLTKNPQEALALTLKEINEPQRIAIVADLESLREKAEGFRNLKKELKIQIGQLGNSNLEQAKKIIIRLYQRYLNTQIADLYSPAVVLASKENRSEQEEEVLDLVRGVGRRFPMDRFSPPYASRSLERIDHFLQGVGLRLNEQGGIERIETVPLQTDSFIKKKAEEFAKKARETEEYKKYKGQMVNAEQAMNLIKVVLDNYGIQDWRVRTRADKTGFSVTYSEEGRVVKFVNTPEDLNKSLPEALRVIAHEVEGHVLRYANERNISFGGRELKLFSNLPTVRGAALSEAGAVLVENETFKEAFGMERNFRGAYYCALKKKQSGGSMKNVFWAILKTQGWDKKIEEISEDNNEFVKNAKTAFRQAVRLFRPGKIPLFDKSRFVPNSEPLAYHDQEIVAQRLVDAGLGVLLFIPRVDVYSIVDLVRLGVLDLKNNVKTPDYVVARKIWPKLKEALDKGVSLDEAISTLSS